MGFTSRPVSFLLILFRLTITVSAAGVVTWNTLIAEQPAARDVLSYCNAISRNNVDCAKDFLGVGLVSRGQPSLKVTSSVSRLAAATCLERTQPGQDRWQETLAMFGVDASRLGLYSASASVPAKFDGANWWSPAARQEAKDKAYKEAWTERRQIRELERTILDKTGGQDEKTARALANLAEYFVDRMHASDQASKAEKNPSLVGTPADMKCTGNLCTDINGREFDRDGVEIPQIHVPGPPVEDPSGDFEQPDNTFDPEDPTQGKREFDPTADPKAIPITRPFLEDETVKTALEKCQEAEEKELWKQIGSETRDPDAESPEEQRRIAEDNLERGICDTKVFGREFCKEYKQKQWKVPLPPDQAQEVKDANERNAPCPINYVEMNECRKASEEIKMRFVMHDDLAPSVEVLFKEKYGFPLLPRKPGKDMHEAILAALEARKGDYPGIRNPLEAFRRRVGRKGRFMGPLAAEVVEEGVLRWIPMLARLGAGVVAKAKGVFPSCFLERAREKARARAALIRTMEPGHHGAQSHGRGETNSETDMFSSR